MRWWFLNFSFRAMSRISQVFKNPCENFQNRRMQVKLARISMLVTVSENSPVIDSCCGPYHQDMKTHASDSSQLHVFFSVPSAMQRTISFRVSVPRIIFFGNDFNFMFTTHSHGRIPASCRLDACLCYRQKYPVSGTLVIIMCGPRR